MSESLDDILEQAQKTHHNLEVLFQIKSGKEATVHKVLFDGEPVAMKVYKTPEERTFQNTAQYIEGKHYRLPSHRKAVAKGNAFGKRLVHDNWVKREYFMLEKLFELGAKIPRPVARLGSAVLMEFLGDDSGPAPRLSDVRLTKEEAETAFESIMETMNIFWEFGIVHGDLSEFNILWWDETPYVIDFPQAIDKRTHPHHRGMLDRDLQNLAKYFGKYFEVQYDRLRERFT